MASQQGWVGNSTLSGQPIILLRIIFSDSRVSQHQGAMAE